MSTHAELSAAITAVGYIDTGKHTCLTPGCSNLRDHRAILAGVSGSMAECQFCIEKRMGEPLENLIERKIAINKKIEHGDLKCDVCGARNARPVPGEGQNLCAKHNHRRGINRWS